MAREKTYKEIKGVFIDKDSSKYSSNWSLDFNKLSDLTNPQFAEEIKELFDEEKDTPRFNAQIIEVVGVNSLGDTFNHYEISLGHYIYSQHYMYNPQSNNWHKVIVNQERFDNIIKSFQEKLNW